MRFNKVTRAQKKAAKIKLLRKWHGKFVVFPKPLANITQANGKTQFACCERVMRRWVEHDQVWEYADSQQLVADRLSTAEKKDSRWEGNDDCELTKLLEEVTKAGKGSGTV